MNRFYFYKFNSALLVSLFLGGFAGIGALYANDYNLELLETEVASAVVSKRLVSLQDTTPGKVQNGNINIDGTAIFSGNVGIGTTTPSSKLIVKGAEAPLAEFYGGKDDWATINFVQNDGTVIKKSNVGMSPPDFFKGGAFIVGTYNGNEWSDPLVIENSAPTGSLYINAAGNVGIGTTTPSSNIVIKGDESPLAEFYGSKEDWATIDFIQEDETGTKKSAIGMSHPDFFNGHAFILGTFNGEEWSDPLVVENFAPTGSFYVNADGNVGIGTTEPEEKLQVEGDLFVTGSITEGSSRKFKDDINNLTGKEALGALKELKPTKFRYKTDTLKEEHLGFIAEEVPDLVAINNRKSLRTMDIVAVLTKVVQDQQKTIETMSKEFAELQSRLKSFE